MFVAASNRSPHDTVFSNLPIGASTQLIHSEDRRRWINEKLLIDADLFFDIEDTALREACLCVPLAISEYISCFFPLRKGTLHERSVRFKEVLEDLKEVNEPNNIEQIFERSSEVFSAVKEGLSLKKIIQFINEGGNLTNILRNHETIQYCRDDSAQYYIRSFGESKIYCTDSSQIREITCYKHWVEKLLDNGFELDELLTLENLSFAVLNLLVHPDIGAYSEEAVLAIEKTTLVLLLNNSESEFLVTNLVSLQGSITNNDIKEFIPITGMFVSFTGFFLQFHLFKNDEILPLLRSLMKHADFEYFQENCHQVCTAFMKRFTVDELSKGLLRGFNNYQILLDARFTHEQIVELGRCDLVAYCDSLFVAKRYHYLITLGFTPEEALSQRVYVHQDMQNSSFEELACSLYKLSEVGVPVNLFNYDVYARDGRGRSVLKWLSERADSVGKIRRWGGDDFLRIIASTRLSSNIQSLDGILESIEAGLEWELVSVYLLNRSFPYENEGTFDILCKFAALCKRRDIDASAVSDKLSFLIRICEDFTKLEQFFDEGLTLETLFKHYGVVDLALNNPKLIQYYLKNGVNFPELHLHVGRGGDLLVSEPERVVQLINEGRISSSKYIDLQELLYPTDTFWFQFTSDPFGYIWCCLRDFWSYFFLFYSV